MPAKTTPGYTTSRIFQGTSVNTTDYSNANYTKAMNQQFATLCDNAKAAGLIVITVSLDLDDDECRRRKAQMDALKACASKSALHARTTTATPMKLYFNATGGTLSDEFKKIADELSNLRIVG